MRSVTETKVKNGQSSRTLTSRFHVDLYIIKLIETFVQREHSLMCVSSDLCV